MSENTTETAPQIPGVANLPNWPIWAPFAAVGFAILVSITIVVALYILIPNEMREANFVRALETDLGFLAVLAGIVVLGFILRGGMSAARIGLTRTSPKVAIGLGIAAFIVVFLVDLLAPVFVEFEQDLSTLTEAGVINAFILAVILAPIVEEIFFRGVLFSALSRKLGVAAGAIISSVLFGLVHFTNSGIGVMAVLAFSGFVWALLYWRTGSIIPGIVLHGFGNAVAVGLQLHLGFWTILIAVASIPLLLLLTLPFAKIRFAPSWPRFLAQS